MSHPRTSQPDALVRTSSMTSESGARGSITGKTRNSVQGGPRSSVTGGEWVVHACSSVAQLRVHAAHASPVSAWCSHRSMSLVQPFHPLVRMMPGCQHAFTMPMLHALPCLRQEVTPQQLAALHPQWHGRGWHAAAGAHDMGPGQSPAVASSGVGHHAMLCHEAASIILPTPACLSDTSA